MKAESDLVGNTTETLRMIVVGQRAAPCSRPRGKQMVVALAVSVLSSTQGGGGDCRISSPRTTHKTLGCRRKSTCRREPNDETGAGYADDSGILGGSGWQRHRCDVSAPPQYSFEIAPAFPAVTSTGTLSNKRHSRTEVHIHTLKHAYSSVQETSRPRQERCVASNRYGRPIQPSSSSIRCVDNCN